jgi:hypothetical protein
MFNGILPFFPGICNGEFATRNLQRPGTCVNLTRLETTNKRGIKGRMKRAGRDNAYLEKILRI